ncbi:AaceriAGL140Cp [[Ashbya] aceris (nom. inval.)]|nr:AaceriAGL140Cp [[Ashbya] aceris (nom. inval.)]
MRVSLVRQLQNSLRLLNSSRSGASSELKAVAEDLYLRPSEWKGLKTPQLLQLHAERQARFGLKYRASEEEIEALLPSATELGIPEKVFRRYINAPVHELEKKLGISKKPVVDEIKEYEYDELPTLAHTLVDQHREQRFYNRLAAYELPLLAQYRQEYQPPSRKTHPVLYRYTTYIGEEHPNSRKVVLSVQTADLGLNEAQLHKLRLLAKTRYDHTTDILKMSSDRYEHAAQNARYLADKLQALINEASDLTDDFGDVPLDTRHTEARLSRKKKRVFEFPASWERPQDAPPKTVNVIEKLMQNL